MGCQPQNLHSLGAPFAAGILLGDDEHLLPNLNAVQLAGVLLARGHLLPKDDVGVGYFHAAEHVIAPLNINPSGTGRF